MAKISLHIAITIKMCSPVYVGLFFMLKNVKSLTGRYSMKFLKVFWQIANIIGLLLKLYKILYPD